MNGTSPAEQHLGDRLAALVDGELDHDARERVQAHLATCPKCKAEADAQRRLKSVFAHAAPPQLSEGLLARLQGLPGGSPRDDDDLRGPFGGGGFGKGVFSVGPDGFGYVQADATGVLPTGPADGFRIHEVARQDTERSAWRARRFAFAAASAVSFAAMALGGSVPAGGAAGALPPGGTGNNVTPMRAPGVPVAPATVFSGANRRQGGGASVPQPSADRITAAPPDVFQAETLSTRALTTGVLNESSPLLRPGDADRPHAPSVNSSPTHLAAPTLPLPSPR